MTKKKDYCMKITYITLHAGKFANQFAIVLNFLLIKFNIGPLNSILNRNAAQIWESLNDAYVMLSFRSIKGH